LAVPRAFELCRNASGVARTAVMQKRRYELRAAVPIQVEIGDAACIDQQILTSGDKGVLPQTLRTD
jgi:hypothetical protein